MYEHLAIDDRYLPLGRREWDPQARRFDTGRYSIGQGSHDSWEWPRWRP